LVGVQHVFGEFGGREKRKNSDSIAPGSLLLFWEIFMTKSRTRITVLSGGRTVRKQSPRLQALREENRDPAGPFAPWIQIQLTDSS